MDQVADDRVQQFLPCRQPDINGGACPEFVSGYYRIVAIQTHDAAEHLGVLRLNDIEARRFAGQIAVVVVHPQFIHEF